MKIGKIFPMIVAVLLLIFIYIFTFAWKIHVQLIGMMYGLLHVPCLFIIVNIK